MLTIQDWKNLLGKPFYDNYEKTTKLIKKYSFEDFDGELYVQSNGILPNGQLLYQKVFVALPKNIKKGEKLPAVNVPFYSYEWTLGMNPETGEKIKKTCILYDLVKRGYIGATAMSYHLTYIPDMIDDGTAWEKASFALLKDNPNWTGMGKLVSDTQRVIDLLEEDSRVDSNKLAMAGHSLGGKMAFYTGCLDDRIKLIMASDFGLLWDQTNWEDPWYWGDKVFELKDKGITNVDLLSLVAPKPFCVIVGYYDDENTVKALYNMKEYDRCRQNLFIVDHSTGHKPPKYALDAAYGFIDNYLK